MKFTTLQSFSLTQGTITNPALPANPASAVPLDHVKVVFLAAGFPLGLHSGSSGSIQGYRKTDVGFESQHSQELKFCVEKQDWEADLTSGENKA